MQVFCDFDGTISIEDATDFVLDHLARPEWVQVEEDWKQGAIGSAECMQRQIPLIEADKKELDCVLDRITIDSGFIGFINFCQEKGMPVIIISDGVDYFIQKILARYHLQHLPVIANRLIMSGSNEKTRYQLVSPYSHSACASDAGVCKCRALEAANAPCVYVGDGRSDFCVSNKPDIVFAKGKLAAYCDKNNIDFTFYHQFTDVTKALRAMLITEQSHRETALQASA